MLLSWKLSKNFWFNRIVRVLKSEKLFIYSFERFFVLSKLMKHYNLQHVFFVEIDNTVYNNPNCWLSKFKTKEMAFMFDNHDRYASGICYFQGTRVLDLFLELCSEYILSSNEFLNEMSALYRMRQKYPDEVQMLPILWKVDTYPADVWKEFDRYTSSVFDAAAMGIYLGGMDPFHTNGVIVKGLKTKWGLLDYTCFNYKWELDEQNRKIPYISDGTNWYRINNLHIHSKDLQSCQSVPRIL